MKIHEFQARALLAGADIPTPDGEMVTTVDAAVAAAERLLEELYRAVVDHPKSDFYW